MKKSFALMCILSLLALPSAAGQIRKAPVIKLSTLKVLHPSTGTTWIAGKTAGVRWTRGKILGARVTISLVQSTSRPPFRKGMGITLASDITDSGQWTGILGKVPAGRYKVVVVRGKQRAFSEAFRILAAPPMPDLTCSIDQVLFSTSSEGEFLGHDIYTTVTNLHHANAPIPATAVIWLRIESQVDTAKHFDHQMTTYEVQTLHNSGSVQFTWNMALDMDMPQPWKLTVDSKNNIAESNESNNTATGP